MIGQIWILHSETGEKFDSINKTQLIDQLRLISEEELNLWYFWQEGMPEWQPFSASQAICDLYEQYKKPKKAEPPVFKAPSAPPPFQSGTGPKARSKKVEGGTGAKKASIYNEKVKPKEEIKHDLMYIINQETNVAPQSISGREQRRFERFQKRFKVLIESGDFIFRSFTHDISLGGMSMTHSLPEKMLTEECTIYITYLDNKDTLVLKANPIIREKDNYKFFSFKDMGGQYKQKLENWLKSTFGSKSA